MQENEDSLEDWAESLTELSTMKTDLSQYKITDDVLLLQEQVEHLHCQWKELGFKTARSLDCCWRNICSMSMERRMRIEETGHLWCKFLEDYSHFEKWLKAAELTVANPNSSDVLYTCAKEELKKFETFQRQVQKRLTQLELVNKQYRRLALENCTDAACKLKLLVHDLNQRWDFLQIRVAAVLRRLKHFTFQREDFEGTHEGILVWLTEMDLQLTNVEHFSESDIKDKTRQLRGFQQEITLNTNKIDALIVFGENLIQKSAPLDAALIEDELEELHSYCQEVFGRVARFHHRLINRRPVLDEDSEISDHETDLNQSPCETNRSSWTEERKKKENEAPALGGVSAGRQAMSHLLIPPLECSGRETPVSVDSIPLEWDPTVDVGESTSHKNEEDASLFSALSVKSERLSWHQNFSPERKCVCSEIIHSLSTMPAHNSSSSRHQGGYDTSSSCPIPLSLPLLPPKEEAGFQAATPISCRGERRDLSLHRPLLCRVIQAAFLLHLLFLVLLVLACLVPLSDQEYSCTLSNNFARSFYPMLHYTNGPPPT